jgi:hypothetical protein
MPHRFDSNTSFGGRWGMQSKVIQLSSRNRGWNSEKVQSIIAANTNELARLARLLITSTYINNNGHIRHQCKGLPMGTNPAPHMADLTCYIPESRFIDQLTTANINLARTFIGTFRYIDDILTTDNPVFNQHIHLNNQPRPQTAIYPPYLLLEKTSNNNQQVDYLGLKIRNAKRSFYCSIANTALRFPVSKVNYPSLHGNFPKILGYGVFTGQLHRFSRACTAANDFIQQAKGLYNALFPKGYQSGTLIKRFKSFIHQHNPYKTPAVSILRRMSTQINQG